MAEVVSTKMDESKRARLQALARKRKTSVSKLINEAVDRMLEESPSVREGTLAEQCGHLFKEMDASLPTDLATNVDHMKGFGQ